MSVKLLTTFSCRFCRFQHCFLDRFKRHVNRHLVKYAQSCRRHKQMTRQKNLSTSKDVNIHKCAFHAYSREWHLISRRPSCSPSVIKHVHRTHMKDNLFQSKYCQNTLNGHKRPMWVSSVRREPSLDV